MSSLGQPVCVTRKTPERVPEDKQILRRIGQFVGFNAAQFLVRFLSDISSPRKRLYPPASLHDAVSQFVERRHEFR